MAKEQEKPTLHKEIEGLLKEKSFVLHGINISSSAESFNLLNDTILESLLENAKKTQTLSDQDRKDFEEMMRQHFHEIKLLRELYDNLKK